MALGKNLLIALYERKMSQKELALAVGCGQPLISQYISGAKTPSLGMCVKIADALGCSVDELVREASEVK